MCTYNYVLTFIGKLTNERITILFCRKSQLILFVQSSVSLTFLPRGTLVQLNQCFEAPLDAKIGQTSIKIDNWRHPCHYLTAPLCAAAPRLRTTGPVKYNVIINMLNCILALNPKVLFFQCIFVRYGADARRCWLLASL